MSSRNVLALVVVFILLLLAGWWYVNFQKPQTQPASTITPQTSLAPDSSPTEQSTNSSEIEKAEATINISEEGFDPKTVTIKAGESVAWENTGKADHQVSSAIHPTHQVYPPLNTIGLLKPGDKKSLMFPDKGTYRFHDHLNPSFTGSVVVE